MHGRDDASVQLAPCWPPREGQEGRHKGSGHLAGGRWALIDTIHVAVLNVFISSDIVAQRDAPANRQRICHKMQRVRHSPKTMEHVVKLCTADTPRQYMPAPPAALM